MPTTLAPSRTDYTTTVRVVPGQTLADLRALPEGTLAQLIDGEIIMSPAPSVLHQHIVSTLGRLLGNFAVEHGLGAVFVSPIDVVLAGGSQSFQPDVVFVAYERRGIIGVQEIEGAPDLVVEVLSPSTGYYDLTQKRDAYEHAGVREYWIVDPERRTVEVLTLEDGAYRTAATAERKGRVASVLLDGFEVEAEALYEVGGQYRRNM
jgi:Uma2 family endonuclease